MINWDQDGWFSKHHAAAVTAEFEAWWVGYYGTPEQYDDKEEYFIRAAFALRGWLAGKTEVGS